jgi:hypothetical protein
MVEEEYFEDLEEDELEEQAERQREIQDEVFETPAYEKKDDLYSLFWKVVKIAESSKVGNLDKFELGMLDISVRDCQRIALMAETLGKRGFARWIAEQAEIILATSASKSGWLPELFVSQRRFSAKTKGDARIGQNLPQPAKKKGLLFGRK